MEICTSIPYPFLTPLKEKSFSRIGPISVEYQSNIGQREVSYRSHIGQREAYQELSDVLGQGEVPSGSARDAHIESLGALIERM